MWCSSNDIKALTKDLLVLFLKLKWERLTCMESQYSKGVQNGPEAEAIYNPIKDRLKRKENGLQDVQLNTQPSCPSYSFHSFP